MPSYNSEKYISDCIESIINQTYPYWELIIIDDCSSDKTNEILSRYSFDDRIMVLKNATNQGAALSRNRGLREAKGRYIAFIDSDDVWRKDKLQIQLLFMKKRGYAFTFTDYRIQLNGRWLPYICTGPNVVTRHKLFDYCYFSTITVIYDRERVGLIQIADIKKNNDYAMWFQALEKTDAYRLPKCLSYYIKHDDSISGGSKIKLIKHHYIMYRKALGKGKCIAVILTVNNLVHGVLKKVIYKKRVNFGGPKNVAI